MEEGAILKCGGILDKKLQFVIQTRNKCLNPWKFIAWMPIEYMKGSVRATTQKISQKLVLAVFELSDQLHILSYAYKKL